MRPERMYNRATGSVLLARAVPCVLVLLLIPACTERGNDDQLSTSIASAGCADEWKGVLAQADAANNDSVRLVVLEHGRTLFKRPGAGACERELLFELAKVHERVGHTDRLIAVYDALLADSMRLSAEESAAVKMKLAKACFAIGLPRSFDYAKEVFLYYQASNIRSDRMLDATGLLVSTYELTGENSECIALLNAALKTAEQEDDIRWTCDLLDRLGGIATRENRGADAVRFHERSLDELARFFRNGAVRDTMVKRPLDSSRTAMSGNRTAQAPASELLTQIHYLTIRHRALKMLGDAQAVAGSPGAAANSYQRAIDLANTSFIHELVPPCSELGGIMLAQGNTMDAVRLGELARQRALADHDAVQVKNAADLLHRAYKQQGDQGRALAMLELAGAYEDTLDDVNFRMGLVKRQTSYAARADSLEMQLEIRDRERETGEERAKARSNRNWTYAIGGASLLLLAASALWYRTDRRRRLERFEKDAAVLETQALRSQMNPHFIFNALNSINAFVQGNDPDMASSFLSKFARVMRLVLENSRHAEVPLESDLEALRGYLDLERKRMRDKFDYSIEIDPDIDPREVMVPPLVVQPFVENAIWHGIAGKEGQGHITLRVQQKGDQLLWIIEDDGIGREAHRAMKETAEEATAESRFKDAAATMKKTSLGTAITRARLDLVQKQYGGRAGWNYVDTPTGTRVEVDMPMRVGG
jgi:lipopolysaccharide biosynthesis regulator YciM